jgi:proteic killer suppression protein
VIHSFADEPTADLFRERNTRAARSVPHELWPVVRRKLKMLDVASQLEDLLVPPGNRLERLRGKLGDRYSIRVNSQYRVTFQWKKGDAYEVRVEDSH